MLCLLITGQIIAQASLKLTMTMIKKLCFQGSAAPGLLLLLSIMTASISAYAQEDTPEQPFTFPPTVQILIHSAPLQNRISIDQNLDDFADLQEAKIRVTNKWHKPVSIRYKSIWYTKSGEAIKEEDNFWHSVTIVPKATHSWEAIAPEGGYDAIVHIK
jgi:uncharacterized protein YcfL